MDSGLPRLVLIADGFTRPEVRDRAEAAVRAGVRWVQLRDHAAEEEVFDETARAFLSRLWGISEDVLASVNTRLEPAEALGLGLHVGVRGPSVAEARRRLGEEAPVGFSAHSLPEGQEAAAAGADYLFYSPIFPTSSKSGHPGVGVAALRTFCAALPGTPVFALGGITSERAAECLAAGAYGVAVLSGILHAPDPAEAARAYLAVLDRAHPKSKIENPK